MKDDLAGRMLPSGSFGENAAWWGIAAIAYNVHTAVKGLILGGPWVPLPRLAEALQPVVGGPAPTSGAS